MTVGASPLAMRRSRLKHASVIGARLGLRYTLLQPLPPEANLHFQQGLLRLRNWCNRPGDISAAAPARAPFMERSFGEALSSSFSRSGGVDAL